MRSSSLCFLGALWALSLPAAVAFAPSSRPIRLTTTQLAAVVKTSKRSKTVSSLTEWAEAVDIK